MKRTLTLIGAILGTVANAIYTLITLIGFLALQLIFNVSTGESIPAFVLIVLIIDLVLCIVSLIFDAISISAWNKEPEGYKKKKGIIITSIVFDFLTIIALLVNFSVVSVLFALTLIASNVLKIIDLSNEDKKVKEFLEQKAKPQVVKQPNLVNTETTSLSKPAVVVQPKGNEKDFETLEKRLVKLISMREKGLINEEEYNELKKELIQGDMTK